MLRRKLMSKLQQREGTRERHPTGIEIPKLHYTPIDGLSLFIFWGGGWKLAGRFGFFTMAGLPLNENSASFS